MGTEDPTEWSKATHGIAYGNALCQFSPIHIHQLPPELLTKIFIDLRRIWVNNHPQDTRHIPAPWVIVMEVYRRWRDIAHESPLLWSYIPASYSRCILEKCLDLSKSAPLVVHLAERMTSSQVYLLLKEAAPRLRCLKVVLSDDEDSLPGFRSLLSSPAPLLGSLSIELWMYGKERMPDWMEGLFAGNTPRLRHLSLQGRQVRAPFLKNLTILEIMHPYPKLNGTVLLSALHHLPDLISLRMVQTLQRPEDHIRTPAYSYTPIPEIAGVVVMSSLKLLSIYGGCYIKDLDFLSHLSYPSTTTLLFSSASPVHHRSPIAAITDFLKINASTRQDFGAFTPTKIEFMLFYRRLKLNLMDNHKTLCALKLGKYSHRLDVSCTPDLDRLLPYLSFPTITHFSMGCYTTPSAWPVISSHFPGLKHLAVESMHKSEVATIFKARIEDSRTEPSRTPIFPNIRTLHIKNGFLDDDCKEKLVQALRDRKKASCGLEKIGVDECDQIDDEFVTSLGLVEGLSVIRCVCDHRDPEDDRYVQYADENDQGEIFRSDVDERYYVHSYMKDDDM
ncbi:hypothetical protein BDN72DRAFT_68156 [Pluteus cervinus]|uniref:Uncharacterized protein n=1 Tax=Pluteus cervinus TaxID=181527 RepID=A0ACD3AQM2_9AGAR|nr:hypothetical protein BDN72DRAFT_68156 [Pluteus cervinus]